jgi:hypothetical protein
MTDYFFIVTASESPPNIAPTMTIPKKKKALKKQKRPIMVANTFPKTS